MTPQATAIKNADEYTMLKEIGNFEQSLHLGP
jgi:hypothetical protein